MAKSIRMRHRTPEERRRTATSSQSAEPARSIVMTRRTQDMRASGSRGAEIWRSVQLPRIVDDVPAYRQSCEDGVTFFLDCEEHTLLTGSSPVRGIFRNLIIDHACASNYPVLILTPSSGSGEEFLLPGAPYTPVHRVDSLSFSTGFSPFSGWPAERIVDFLQGVMVQSGQRGNPFQRRILSGLLTLCRTDAFVSSGVADGSLYGIHSILDHFEETPHGRDADEICSLLAEDVETSNRALSEIHDFLRFCTAGGTEGEPWTLLSPGITLIDAASSDAYEGQRGGSWYLRRLLPYLIEDVNRLSRPVVVVADCVSQEVMNAYTPLLQCAGARLVLVTDSVMDLAPHLRGKASRQIVFCQTDGEASGYWAGRTGSRQILMTDWSKTHSQSRRTMDWHRDFTDSETTHYGYQYRPNYESSDFSGLDPWSGFLFKGENGEPCHRFFFEG